jgi:hypothetical protein
LDIFLFSLKKFQNNLLTSLFYNKACYPLLLFWSKAAIAERSHVKRESLYQMLSKRGNPELTSLFNVLHGMGLTITIQPIQEA